MASSRKTGDARRRGLLVAACVATAWVTGLASPAAAQMTPAQAEQMVTSGQADQAYRGLISQLAQRAGDPDYDSALGFAALESGRYAEAVLAYERVLAVQPDNYRARAQLGLAYAQLGDLEAGRRELAQIEDAPLSADERAGVSNFLTLLNTRLQGGERRTGGFVEVGGGYDSNVNGATQDTTLLIPALAVLGPATLSGGATAQESGFIQAAGNLYFENPLSRARSVFASATGRVLEQLDEDDFSQYRLNLDGGMVFNTPRGAQGTVAAQFEQYWLGGDSYRQTYGAFGQWRAPLRGRYDMSVQVSYGYLSYDSNLAGDAHRGTAGVIVTRRAVAPSQTAVFAGLYLGGEEATDRVYEYSSHGFAGLRAGAETQLSSRMGGFVELNYEYREYDADYPLFFRNRIDNSYNAQAGLVVGLTPSLSLRPTVRFTEQVSNIGLFDYDRWSAAVNLRHSF